MKENIFDITFPWFQKGIETVVPSGELSLKQFINAIKNPKPKMKKAFIDIQKAAEVGDIKLKDELKQNNLFFTTPSVILHYRNYASIEKFTPFVVLEYDKIEYAEILRNYIFSKFESCIFAFTSPSKTGCKFIFLLEKCPENIDEYKEYYFGIAYHLDKFKGFDISNANCVLPLFNSWDEDALIRENPIGSSWKGYKENAFIAPEIKIDPKGKYTEKEKKDCISLIKYLISKIEGNGHPQVVKTATICGGLSSYYGIEDLWWHLKESILNNDYLSKGTNGYLKTARDLFDRGSCFPMPLNKNQ